MNDSNMSKKTAIAGMAITAIAASDNLQAQICICLIGGLGIVVQAIVDAKKESDK